MALTVEDGTGLADADAYVDVAFVDAYAANYGKTDWEGLASQTDQEMHIRRATQFVDNNYLSGFQPLTSTQRLAFPAKYAYVRGHLVTGVPIQVKEAVAELANISVTTSLVDVQSERQAIQRTVKAGDVSKSETFSNSIYTKLFHPVELILRPLDRGTGRIGQGFSVVGLRRA